MVGLAVTWSPYPPLPAGAIRDLLGITRALYCLARDAGAGDAARLEALASIGRTLSAVLAAASAAPGTTEHGQAWLAVERAKRELAELVAHSPDVAALVAATAQRISRPGSMV